MTTLQEEIAAIQARIAKVRCERDTWRTSGMEEDYLEACSLLQAFEMALEQLRQEGLRFASGLPAVRPAMAGSPPAARS